MGKGKMVAQKLTLWVGKLVTNPKPKGGLGIGNLKHKVMASMAKIALDFSFGMKFSLVPGY